MNKKLAEELKESIREAGAVRRGQSAPHRVWRLTKLADGTYKWEKVDARAFQKEQAAKWSADKDVTGARKALDMSQSEFARLLGISVRTLHHWEQGRRTPTGAARVLLRVAKSEPRVLKRVLAAVKTP